MNAQSGRADRFINCGINGLFPLAMEGLVEDYGSALRNRTLIVHCNLLWMTSPKADLSIDKEESFNHSRLVPQFSPRIPCYKAKTEERLSATLENHVEFFAWTNHLQNAYYDQKSLAQWTLHEDDSDPPRYVNAWRNPLAPLAAACPANRRTIRSEDRPARDTNRGTKAAQSRRRSSGSNRRSRCNGKLFSESFTFCKTETTMCLSSSDPSTNI